MEKTSFLNLSPPYQLSNRRQKLLWLTCLPLLLCAPCHAQGRAARQAVQAQYDRWAVAYAKSDTATLLHILAPDFTLKTGKGKVLKRGDYKTILLKRSVTAHPPISYKTQINRFQVSAHAATAYTTETLVEEKPAGNRLKKPIKTTHIHQYRDKWVLRNHQWLLRFSETLDER